jgi:hypothetical protein
MWRAAPQTVPLRFALEEHHPRLAFSIVRDIAAVVRPGGGTWNEDDEIVFAPDVELRKSCPCGPRLASDGVPPLAFTRNSGPLPRSSQARASSDWSRPAYVPTRVSKICCTALVSGLERDGGFLAFVPKSRASKLPRCAVDHVRFLQQFHSGLVSGRQPDRVLFRSQGDAEPESPRYPIRIEG